MEDVHSVRVGVLEPVAVGQVAHPVKAVELQGNEGERDRGGVGRPRHAAGGFADAQVRREETDHVHAGAGVGAPEGGAVRTLPLRKIVDQLPRVGGDRKDPELPVLVLGPVALEEGQLGDAPKPCERVRESGPTQRQVDDAASLGAARIELEGRLPGARMLGGIRPGRPPVDKDVEFREARLDAARAGMGPELPAEDERAHIGDRWKPDDGRLPDPRGVGGELVEKKAGIAGEAPGEGAAEGPVVKEDGHGQWENIFRQRSISCSMATCLAATASAGGRRLRRSR